MIFDTVHGNIVSIDKDEEIKYLGVSFNKTLLFHEHRTLEHLHNNLDNLIKTHLLQPHQKLVVINQFICPTLIYPFQTTPIEKIPKKCLIKADNIIKSAIKEILQLPSDTPTSMLYSSHKYKGLSIIRTTWEAFLQQLNINHTLELINDPHVNAVRDYKSIKNHCLKELQIENTDNFKSVKQLRQILRQREFEAWCDYPHKGKGVSLFAEVPSANSWILKRNGLSCSEWRDMLKMTAMVIPVRTLPGRSSSTGRCRHCSEYETLPHVLGNCPQGALLRTKRHNTIRTILAEALKQKNLEVHEEVHCIADGGSNRRIDIIAINRKKDQAEIVDPTIRFEVSTSQPFEVDTEKKNIYNPTIPFFQNSYGINNIQVTGLLLGARGTIPKLFVTWREKYKLEKKIQEEIVTTIIKFSVSIVRNHLYGQTSI